MPELKNKPDNRGLLFLLVAMLLTALATGTGWGIRGQYGHESGAMNAGALGALALLMLFVPHLSSLTVARAAALMTIAIGIGGSMTYGQTVGLTHDGQLIGNWEALRWGMLGLAIKGGIWISFAGAFLGIGLGGKKYGPWEMLGIMLAMIGLMFLGVWLLNSPFDPANRILPNIYFSDDWRFEEGDHVKPRPEVWGGYLLALVALMTYVRLVKGDKLALRMAIVGFIAGGLGFPGGQCTQAFHAWSPETFQEGGFLARDGNFLGLFASHFNWWNIMETTFGCIWGAVMALGLWMNRHLIVDDPAIDESRPFKPTWEIGLIIIHLTLLVSAEYLRIGAITTDSPTRDEIRSYFLRNPQIIYIQFGMVMSTIPLIGCIRGRIWPYLMVTSIVAIPIMGKTLLIKGYLNDAATSGAGWMFLIILPLGVLTTVATFFCSRSFRRPSARYFVCSTMVLMVWVFFWLNSDVFNHAFPWVHPWGGRHPNQLMFFISAIVLTIAAIVIALKKPTSGQNGVEQSTAAVATNTGQ